MHSLARQFPRYATTSKTRQGASLDESPMRRPESASFFTIALFVKSLADQRVPSAHLESF